MAGWLAFAAIVSHAANASPSDQQPIQAPDFDTPTFIDNDSPAVSQSGTAARIVLFPASRIYPDDLRDMGKKLPGCSETHGAVEIELEPDVCLSGEYYARDNLKVLEAPSCPDGSTPTLMFYQNRRCTGSARKVSREEDETVGRCLWSEQDIPVSSYYWSLIYRCGLDSDNDQIDGALEHQTAEPQSMIYSALGGAPGEIRNHHGTMFPCHSEHANGTHPMSHRTDNCHWPLSSWPLETIEIVTPAVCANGTRAQLIRYETKGPTGFDYQCNYHEMTLQEGVMDVDDWMLNTCIDMSRVPLLNQGFGRALGRMFFCEGQGYPPKSQEEEAERQEAERESRGSKITHSECAISAGRYQWEDFPRPTTYMYLKPMTCMSLPKGQQVRLTEKATCASGAVGRLATWTDAGCPGMPRKIEPINTLGCESPNLAAESSYMIWCDGEDRVGDQRDLKNSKKAAPGDSRAVVSWDECPRLNMEPGWTVWGREDGPTIRRVHADEDCLSIPHDDQLTVYESVKCPRGKKAKLSVWLDNSKCRGKPDSKRAVSGLMDKCTQICTKSDSRWSCSAQFTCEK